MPLDVGQLDGQGVRRTIAVDGHDVAAIVQSRAARILLARLEYTRVQRRIATLQIRTERGIVLPSFQYEIVGMPTGLHEGVILGGGAAEMPTEQLQHLAVETGAALFKLTRPAALVDGASPLDTPTRTLRTPHWTIVRRPIRARELLSLAPSYHETLAGFGRHTRRNIRAVRRRAETDRLRFYVSADADLIAPEDHARLARTTQPRSIHRALSQRFETYADRSGHPFRTVLRGSDGHIVSYTCGYFGSPAAAYLLYQLNDPAANHLSPSLLHRSFLIEWLIRQGCRELVFVHGCSGILFHACVRQPLEEILLVQRSSSARARAAAIGLLKPKASLGRLARLAFSAP